MTSRKELLTLIEKTERNLQKNRIQLLQHRDYFSQLTKNNGLILSLVLIPALALGWQLGKKKINIKKLSPLARMFFIPVMRNIHKFYLSKYL